MGSISGHVTFFTSNRYGAGGDRPDAIYANRAFEHSAGTGSTCLPDTLVFRRHDNGSLCARVYRDLNISDSREGRATIGGTGFTTNLLTISGEVLCVSTNSRVYTPRLNEGIFR